VTNAPGAPLTDPFALALRYLTDPYARGGFTQPLTIDLDPSTPGQYLVEGYSFDVFQARFGVQSSELAVSYVLTLQDDLGGGPRTIEVDHSGGPNPAVVPIPDGALPGMSFVVPTPVAAGPLFVQAIREHPGPATGEPAGGQKWALTAVLGHVARLLWLLLNERQTVAAVAGDVAGQDHLLTARGASLDHLGQALGVPRQLPSPYRLDLDTHTLALYHLDDAVAPVLDTMHDNPGVNVGAQRGAIGKFGGACTVTPQGGLVVPDTSALEIGAGQSFTVEMFASLPAAVPAKPLAVFAVKRPKFDSSAGPGWFLGGTYVAAGSVRFTFSLTDRAGQVVEATTVDPQPLPASWFHVAGVLDRASGKAQLYLNGKVVATAAAAGLGVVANCADIGLGADRLGVSQLTGSLDEVRFSSVARADFSAVLGAQAKPYASDPGTIALYHLDETDDWVDEDRGLHYGINHGATRGVPARFGSGLRFDGDPLPRADSPSERAFQKLLVTGAWDKTAGSARVRVGPYARYGYKQGAISLPGLTPTVAPVMINDDPTVGPNARGMVTSAHAGFVPTDLAKTIKAFTDAGHSVQEGIDFFGEWNGQPETFFTQQYALNKVTATHEPCPADPPRSSYVEIPASPGFSVGAKSGLTVEAVIKPVAMMEDYPRAVAATRSTGLRDDDPAANEAGWALAVGRFNGIPNNVRWVVGNAQGKRVAVSAGFGVADNAFHHVAGVIDRDGSAALLFVDGIEVAKEPLGALGAVDATGSLFLGNAPTFDAPFAGLIDEVRISDAPRRTFRPVLGEGDDRYRQRLAIFTPRRFANINTLRRGVRALSLPVSAGSPDPSRLVRLLLENGPPPADGQLDVLETDSQRFGATRCLRVIPARIERGQSIAADGSMPADLTKALSPAPFHPEAIFRLADTPGLALASEAFRLVVLPAAKTLEYLAGRVLALDPKAVINVTTAWDATADALQANGRLLTLTVTAADPRLDNAVLGALAHQAGAAFVWNRPQFFFGTASSVRVAVAAGPELDLTGPPFAPLGQSVTLTVARPTLPDPSKLEWELVLCGTGGGKLVAQGASATFSGATTGAVIIQVRYPLARGAYLRGAVRMVVAPQSLDGCDVLGGDGREGVAEATASGSPETDFQVSYLVRSADPSLDYASEAARRMQLPLENTLKALARLAAAEPGAPRVTVLAAYDPAASSLQSVGRGLVVAPSPAAKLTAARLGALAFQAGFAYTERRRYPPSVYVSVAQGDRFSIVNGPIERLWPNARVSGQGVLEPHEFVAAGPPDAGFTAAMVQPYTGAGVAFVTGISNAVQAGLASALNALVAALKNDGVVGTVQILAGFDPKATTLAGVGRAVQMRHPTLGTDRLAGYALQVGFGFVYHQPKAVGGPAVYASAYPNTGPPLNVAGPDDLLLNALTLVRIRPELTGAGQLDWGLAGPCGGNAILGTAPPDPAATGPPRKVLRVTRTGRLVLTAAFSIGDAAEPYQLLVRPTTSPSADGPPEPRITKDQYDDLMNYLEAFLPVGVGAVAAGIRRYVHGFHRPARWDRLPAGQTYPRYRTKR
jgi:hypothetical protein